VIPPADAPSATRIDTVDVCLLGQPLRVHGDTAVIGEIRRLLRYFRTPPLRVDPPAVSVRRTPDGYAVAGLAPGQLDGTAGTVAEATTRVLAVLNATALAGTGCLAVHAGVVARGGRAVAFPAGSGQGKSTLTAACLRAGLAYVSDEALCLDWRDGGVLPYPRPIELSAWSRATVGLPGGIGGPGDALVTAAELNAEPARPPLVLDHVVLPHRHAGTGGDAETAGAGVRTGTEVDLEPVPRQQAAAALLTRSFNHWRDPARAFELVHQVVSGTQVWRLRLGDPTRAAALIGGLLD
jgi:hypothetical protein